jgi:anion transporter
MNNYKMEKLPKREKSKTERFLMKIGIPLALISFILILFVLDLDFLKNFDQSILSLKSKANLDKIGLDSFIYSNKAMLAVFVASLILWVTEPIPNYLTSLILIITLVLTKVLPEQEAYAQLGHKVMWLNILSFILASMLVATGVAKRFALWFIIKFGKNSASIIFSFVVINMILSLFISATTAKSAILLPIFMVVAAVYGASNGNKNNFGRNIVLQNLFQNNMGASAFLTGSGANLLAASLIAGAMGKDIFFSDWMIASFPVAVLLMIIAYFVGTRIFFPIPKEERTPVIEGGMDKLKEELQKMGKIGFDEIKSIIIFSAILGLWVTDKYHGISPTAVAFLGAIIALMPKIGVVEWNDIDIPWHLLIFSAGAYTLGAGLKVTDLSGIAVNSFFDSIGIGNNTSYMSIYMILTAGMVFSALIFQSKTMRTMIFIPISIGIASRFGFSIMSLAFPLAMLIEHVYTLPFNSKPALLSYSTNQYSWTDTFKFGITMQFIAWVVSIIMGMTYFKLLGIT